MSRNRSSRASLSRAGRIVILLIALVAATWLLLLSKPLSWMEAYEETETTREASEKHSSDGAGEGALALSGSETEERREFLDDDSIVVLSRDYGHALDYDDAWSDLLHEIKQFVREYGSARIAVQVSNPKTNEPFTDVAINVLIRDSTALRVWLEREGFSSAAIQVLYEYEEHDYSLPLWNLARTDESGRAEIVVPDGLALELSTSCDERGVDDASKLVAALEKHETRSIVLLPAIMELWILEGTVESLDGRSITEFDTVVLDASRHERQQDLAGTNRFRIEAHSFYRPSIKIKASGYHAQRAHMVCADGQTGAFRRIVLDPNATVRGRITTTQGKPVTDAELRLLFDEDTNSPFSTEDCSARYEQTNSDGEYIFADLPRASAARLEIREHESGDAGTLHFREIELPNAGALEFDIVLNPASRIVGHVYGDGGFVEAELPLRLIRAPEELRGLPAGTVGLIPEEWRRATTRLATSDESGGYAFQGVTVGSWLVAIHSPHRRQEYSSAPLKPRALATSGVLIHMPEGTLELPVDLPASRGLSIRGMVVDNHGSPLAGILLEARPTNGFGFTRTTSARSGAFELGPLVPGPYLVTLAERGHPDGSGDRSELAGPWPAQAGEQELRLQLPALRSIQGRLLNPPMRPERTRVRLYPIDPPHDRIGVRASMDGSFRFDGLASGDYALIAYTDTLATAVHHVKPGQLDLELELQPAAMVEVSVEWPRFVEATSHGLLVFQGGAVIHKLAAIPWDGIRLPCPPGPTRVEIYKDGVHDIRGMRWIRGRAGGSFQASFSLQD